MDVVDDVGDVDDDEVPVGLGGCADLELEHAASAVPATTLPAISRNRRRPTGGELVTRRMLGAQVFPSLEPAPDPPLSCHVKIESGLLP